MRNRSTVCILLFAALAMLSGISCIDKKVYPSPPGYDLNAPVKYNMPENLTEISGIAFNHGIPDSVYAEEDEKGRVYYFKQGEKDIEHTEFGKPGDYEDIAIINKQVVMLRSDGILFVFPLSQVRAGQVTNVKKWKDILPQGEYEGLFADEASSQLYVLCKHCSDDNTSKTCSGYSFKVAADGSVKQSGTFAINVRDIAAKMGADKITFHPSAITKNFNTNEWYVLSSVNKVLVVVGADWKVKTVYPINPALFRQPEGIAFDNQHNLYISNEGDKITPGNILKFNYKK